MLNLNYEDISNLKEFKKFKDTFKQVRDYGNNVFLYSRENPDAGGVYMWELVRGVYRKNINGTEVHTYPSPSLWGMYGYSILKGDYPNLDKYVKKLTEKKCK